MLRKQSGNKGDSVGGLTAWNLYHLSNVSSRQLFKIQKPRQDASY